MNIKNVLLVMFLAGLVLAAAGCTGSGSNKPKGPVKARWIAAAVTGDTVSIPKSTVDSYTHVHFNVPYSGHQLAFMAYDLNSKIYVRANVCPPCGSIGFTLSGNTLVCDTCGTTFEAATGRGISGGCVAYPKEEVPYALQGDNMVMNLNDAVNAYANTIQSG